MNLAVKELVRERRRFITVIAAVALINVLLLFLISQLDGLTGGQTGAIVNQNGQVAVFSEGVEASIFRSSLPLTDLDAVRAVDGVADAGAVGILFGAGRTTARDAELFDMGVFGFDAGRPGAPANLVEGRLPRAGERRVGAIDVVAKAEGVEIGDRIRFGSSPEEVEVVGFVRDSTLQLQPVLWVDLPEWRTIREDVRPERSGGPPDANVIFATVESGASPEAVARAITDDVAGTEALTIDETIAALPGVAQQQGSFFLIIAVTYIAAAIVITLFFALLTLEKVELIGVLKAVGARNAGLAATIVLQGLIVSVLAFGVAAGLTLLMGAALPAGVPFSILPGSWLTIGIITVVVGALGALVSFRRIAGIDPATAVGGGQ